MTYPLDDAYIHIALAKQFAASGIWGVQPGEWAFCSSSPLWTLILSAFYRVFGVVEWLPLVLSLACLAGAAWAVWRLVPRHPLVVAAVFFCLPASVVGMLGMEHALHVWLTLELVLAWREGRSWPYLAVLSALTVATRYETLFLLAPLAACSLRSRPRLAGAMVLGGALPVVAYAVFALAHGGYWLPNSLLLKGGGGSVESVCRDLRGVVARMRPFNLHLRLLFIVCAVLAWRDWRTTARLPSLPLALAAALVAQMAFCDAPNFYRYDAWLVAPVLALAAAGCVRWRTTARGLRVAAVLVFVWLAMRGSWATWRAIGAPSDVYGQQVQMARLFAGLAEDEKGPIAVNDIGYMLLHAGSPIVDVWGLGSQEVTRLRREGRYDRAALSEVFRRRGVRYAAVYESWVPRATLLPAHMVPVARLVAAENHACWSREVCFYAADNASAAALRRRIAAFRHELPPGVAFEF